MTTMRTIVPQELDVMSRRGQAVDLIDVRTADEFLASHAGLAKNIPLDALDPRAVMRERGANRDEPLYLVCRSGNRARKAGEAFIAAGFDNVVNVEGGMQAWESAGLPVIRSGNAISLERQVRIAAGALVLAGTVLGLLVHRGFFGLSGFVGAGLVFAGVSNTCGLSLLLMKMPWNRAMEKGVGR